MQARGKEGADFISAYARSYKDKNALKEACWYPVDRLLELYPDEASQDVNAVVLDHYKRMSFDVRAFKTKPPPRFILLGIPLAFCVAAVGFVILLTGPKKTVAPTSENDEKPGVDRRMLATELTRLRRDLER
ncbi:hypothetical protein [Rhizobium sp. FKL33]|uniref:hypothetical protein n=1 Tax=Rhizobium sp. FKL33 TaxID=2562307 RepID=UPI0010BFA917|nr:hypothetical protein [Rhizobium sp. FKL33]